MKPHDRTIWILIGAFLLLFTGGIYYFTFGANSGVLSISSIAGGESQIVASEGSPSSFAYLSADKKSIISDGAVLLAVDDDTIFDFFKYKSNTCDAYNMTINLVGKKFCEDKLTFRSLVEFTSVAAASDHAKVGFTIRENEFGRTVVGIFYPWRKEKSVILLTGDDDDNEFLSFSPSGANFVYREGCFELACAFNIKNTETLGDMIDFIPPDADARGNYEFVRWISDNKIVYTLDEKEVEFTIPPPSVKMQLKQ